MLRQIHPAGSNRVALRMESNGHAIRIPSVNSCAILGQGEREASLMNRCGSIAIGTRGWRPQRKSVWERSGHGGMKRGIVQVGGPERLEWLRDEGDFGTPSLADDWVYHISHLWQGARWNKTSREKQKSSSQTHSARIESIWTNACIYAFHALEKSSTKAITGNADIRQHDRNPNPNMYPKSLSVHPAGFQRPKKDERPRKQGELEE